MKTYVNLILSAVGTTTLLAVAALGNEAPASLFDMQAKAQITPEDTVNLVV